MKKKNLAEIKILEGHSRESIELIENNGKRYVLKKWLDPEKGKKSIEKQITFEEIISGSIRIKSPKIVDNYLDNKGNFIAIMEYIEGFSGSDLHKISSFQFSKNLKQAFSLVLSRNIDSSKKMPLDSNLVIKKLEKIKKECFDEFIIECIDRLIKIVKKQRNIEIMVGSCHGDLTTSNIIATGPSTFYLIDFLPCFIETPIWDLCKMRQDLVYGWSTRKMKGHILNNNKILFNSLIPYQLINYQEKNDIVEKIFDAINIARIAPYLKDEISLNWVKDKFKISLNKI